MKNLFRSLVLLIALPVLMGASYVPGGSSGSSVPSPVGQSGKVPVSNGTIYQMQSLSDFGGGDVLGPETNTANFIPAWNGANSKTLKDGYMLDTDSSMAADSNMRVASQKAIAAALATKAASSHEHGGEAITSGTVAATRLPANSSSSAGIVTSGAGQNAKVWKTDASGNPDWRADATGAAWGAITGTLSAQEDLATALGEKAAASHEHAGSAITSGTVAATYLPSNSSTGAGIVSSGSSQVNKVWKTDAAGVPSWRDDATGGTPTFDTVGSGTNVSGEMTVGTGAFLTYSGSGYINANRFMGVTSVDATEFGYIDGVTGAIQAQLNAKAPSNATYLTTTSESGLSAEANLGALSTGLVKITVTGGVATPSTAISGTDYVIPGGNVATATALAANGANCSANQAPLGVNASGAVESCWSPARTDLTLAQFAATTSAQLSGVLSDENTSGGYMTDPMTTAGDLIQGGASGVPQRLAAVATGNVLISGGVGTVSSWGKVTEAHMMLSDNTTGNFSTSAHGFVPKGTNVGNYLKDDGTWGNPTGNGDVQSVGDCLGGACNDETSDGGTWIGLYSASGSVRWRNNAGVMEARTVGDAGYANLRAGTIEALAVDGSNKIVITNNTVAMSPTASTMEIYPEANVWKLNQNGTEYSATLSASGNQVTLGAMTNGGLPYVSATNTISSTGALTNHGLVVMQGASAAPVVAVDVTHPTYALFANTSADPSFRAIAATDLPVVTASKGGTGVANNDANTFTFAGGNYSFTATLSGNTNITFPTSGTMQTTTGTPAGFVIASQAAGDLLYASSNSAWSRLGIQAAGYILAGGSTPSWSNAPQITTIELGAASDTTLARSAAGIVTVESNTVPMNPAPVIGDPDNFAANFTGANLYGGTYICNAAGTAALPNATVGMSFTIVLEGTGATVIEPLATGTDDTIYLNGTALTQGHNITSSTSGAMCVFQYRSADAWMATCNGFVDGS